MCVERYKRGENMLNKNRISIILGIMCFALTLGIVVQVKTIRNTNSTISQNQEANELRDEILRYKERYDNRFAQLEDAEKELEKQREEATQNNSELEKAQEQITKGNKLTGMTEVTGPGVIITLTDGKGIATSTLNPSQFIVHDLDVLSVVNELINAGAEAISINDQRWVLTTAISCRGNTIDINGERIGAPFVIKAIGLPEYLAGLERVGGYLELMQSQGVGVTLERSNHITIPKYLGVINFEYLQNVE